MRQVWAIRAGGPEVLRVQRAPLPHPLPGEVRVRAAAMGVNFADIMGRLGIYPDAPRPPYVPGYEVAGMIDAVGEGVDPARVGQQVLALTQFGGYSEAVCIPALAAIPRPFLFLVSAKYVKIPFLGTHLRRSGHFPVDADDLRASLKVMTAAARRIEERRVSILLFPEGRRAKGATEEFKEGAAYIAIKARTAVLPFAIRGTREVLPVGSVAVRGGRVELIVGEPIETRGMSLRDREELTALIRQRVMALQETARAERIPA